MPCGGGVGEEGNWAGTRHSALGGLDEAPQAGSRKQGDGKVLSGVPMFAMCKLILLPCLAAASMADDEA